MKRGANIPFLIANDFQLDVRRKLGLYSIQLRLGVVNYFHGVRPGLAPNLQSYRGNSVETRDRSLLLGSVLDSADVAKLDRRALDVCHDQLFHLARIRITPEGPQNQFALVGFDITSRHIGVLTLQSIAQPCDWNRISSHSFGIDRDIDR